MANDELDDLLGPDSDGAAYQKTEERTGPPLDYVAEKMVASLVESHKAHRMIRALLLGTAQNPVSVQNASAAEEAGDKTRGAFHLALVAFLALVNMLDLANDTELVDSLLKRDTDSFHDWIENVRRNGSVTG